MDKKKYVKTFYDKHWLKNYKELEKDDFTNFEVEARNYLLKKIFKNFNTLKNKKLLEIGPGKGYSIIQFAKLGFNVTAIDISQESLNLSEKLIKQNKLSKKIKLIKMDAHNLRFKPNTFDVIFIQTTLMHLNYLKVTEGCKRVLKKNGLLIFFEPLNDNPLIIIYRNLFSEFKESKPRYLKYKDLLKASKFFNEFKIKGFYLISFLCLFLRKTILYNTILTLLKKKENILINIIPSLEKYCWIQVAIYKK